MGKVHPAAVAAASVVSALVFSAVAEAAEQHRRGKVFGPAGFTVTISTPLAQACAKAAQRGAAYATAVATCSRALEEENLIPYNRAGTHVNRGVLRMYVSDLDGALADFEHAVAMRPLHGEAFVDRAIVRIAKGDHRGALADIERGLALGVDQQELAYYHRAVAREELSDLKGAYADYLKASQLQPSWSRPRQDLARFRVISR